MRHPTTRTFLVILLAGLLAVMGAVSAHRMAPDRAALELQADLQALDASVQDICHPGEDDDGHRCPFCHKLPEPPRLAAPENGARIVCVRPPRAGRDLVVGPRDVHAEACPRAPPRIV